MTVHDPGDGGRPRALISEAVTLYETAAEVFALVIDEARAGEPKAAREAVGYARDFRMALQAVLTEREKIEKLRGNCEGIVHDRTLDFERARAEIGRRLACLRDAGDGG